MAKAGRGAQALATAAIGSFIAGTIGTLLVAFFTPALAEQAVKIGAASYFAIMLLSVVLVTSVLGESKLRGFIGLFIGLTIGLVGLDLSTGQPRLTVGMLELADGIDIVVVAVGVFAIGEALWIAAHLRRRARRRDPGRPAVHGAASDWRRSWGPWLRGTAIGFPFGAMPGRRCRDADVPVLRPRATPAEAGQGPGDVRRGRHRGRRRTGGRQQRQRRRHVRAAAGPRPPRDRDRRGDHRRDAHLRHPARADPDGRPARARLDAAGQPAHRQHPAAGHQPAAGARCGPGCCRSRGPSSTPGSCSSRRWAPTASTRTRSTWRCCWSSAGSASRSGGSGSRCCR